MTGDSSSDGEIDVESLDLGPLKKHARAATFAANWKTILATDASLGLVLALIGLAIIIWLGWAGWILIALGVIYIGLVGRRFFHWRSIRQLAGLD